jgi:hypothetical protein
VNRNASGQLGAARASADVNQYLGCSVTWNNGVTSASCYARNAAMQSAGCSSTSPSFIALVQALPAHGFIRLNWDASGACAYLSVSNYSYNLPMSP